MSDLAKEWLHTKEIIEPILTEAVSRLERSGVSGKAKVLPVSGWGIRLAVELGSGVEKLTFSFEVTPRKFKVIHTNSDDGDYQMDERDSLSEVTADLVQSHVDDFLAKVTPK